MSSKNPFRPPQPEMAVVPPSPLPPIPHPDKLPAIPPPGSPTAAGPSSQSETPSSSSNLAMARDILEEDLPPPYTPAAIAGEETVGLGPRRPFQPPPPLPQPSHLPPRPHSNWPPPPVPPPRPPPRGPFTPPPDSLGLAPWQTQQQYRRRPHVGGGLIGALLDTIADAVSGPHNDREAAIQRANASAYAASYPTRQPTYAPPPAPPPPPRPATAPPHSPPPVPDDGSPTQAPVPGHPLLLDGRLLVYPRDHLCVKCRNTGYKDYDPSHPCRKCWDNYGRPYTGALSYTPWSPSQNDPRMQRPLPKFIPPHFTSSSLGSYSGQPFAPPCGPPPPLPPPPRHPYHNRSISHPHCLPSQGPEVSFYVKNPVSPRDAPPVPNAVAVEPGDPRLGGRLCMRCRGAGVQTMLLFDTIMCDSCSGTGRVWM